MLFLVHTKKISVLERYPLQRKSEIEKALKTTLYNFIQKENSQPLSHLEEGNGPHPLNNRRKCIILDARG